MSGQEDVTFGECAGGCGRGVERVGWDSYCFSCQDEMRDEDEDVFEEEPGDDGDEA